MRCIRNTDRRRSRSCRAGRSGEGNKEGASRPQSGHTCAESTEIKPSQDCQWLQRSANTDGSCSALYSPPGQRVAKGGMQPVRPRCSDRASRT